MAGIDRDFPLHPAPDNWQLGFRPGRDPGAPGGHISPAWVARVGPTSVLAIHQSTSTAFHGDPAYYVTHWPVGGTPGDGMVRTVDMTFDEALAYADVTLIAMRLAWPR